LHVPLLYVPAWSRRGFDPLMITPDVPSLNRQQEAAAGNRRLIEIPSKLYTGQVVDIGRLWARLCRARVRVPVAAFVAEGEPTIADAQQLLSLEDICGERLRVVRIATQMHNTLNSAALWPAQDLCFSEMLLGADADCEAGSQVYNSDIDCSFRALLADVPRGLRLLLRRYIPLVRTTLFSGAPDRPLDRSLDH